MQDKGILSPINISGEAIVYPQVPHYGARVSPRFDMLFLALH
jgi:hypothetical protein